MHTAPAIRATAWPALPAILAATIAAEPVSPKAAPGPDRETRPAKWAQPLRQEGLPNLHKVSDVLYRSAQPSPQGMRQLKEMGVKTVVNLRSFHSDRDEIGETGLAYEHMYVKAWHPENKEVVRFLQIVTDKDRTPVLVHCQHGADRTGLMCAVYRVAVCGWSKEEAMEEMTKGGFGYHSMWMNLPKFMEKLDVAAIKKRAGLPPAPPRADDALGTVLLLHLDETGTEVRDTSGEDCAVAVHGASPGAPGRFGAAFGFNGKDACIEVDATLCLPAQTIELWVRPAAGGAGGLMSSQAQPGRSSWRWRLVRNADDTVSFRLWDNNRKDAPDREVKSTAPVPAGVWTHLAVTIDVRQAQEATLFVNGKRQGAVRVTSNHPHGKLYLGMSTFEGWFAGEIDEAAVFDRALSPEAVAEHAAARTPLPDGVFAATDSIALRPVADTAWFTFKHPLLGRRRWMLRMPEYMHYDEAHKRHQTPYGVRWSTTPDRTQLTLQCDLPEEKKKELCLDFRGTVVARKDAIDYELHVSNVGETQWDRPRMVLFCLQCNCAPGFLDYEAKRTFVHRDGKWITMNEVVQGKFAPHRMAGVGVRRGQPPGAERIAARVSEDGKFVLGIATDRATSLSFNFNDRIACLHSNPEWGKLKPGEEATAKGKVYLFQGTLKDLWRRYCQDFNVALSAQQ